MRRKLYAEVRIGDFLEFVYVGLIGGGEVHDGCFRVKIDCFSHLHHCGISTTVSFIVIRSQIIVALLFVTKQKIDHALFRHELYKTGIRVKLNVVTEGCSQIRVVAKYSKHSVLTLLVDCHERIQIMLALLVLSGRLQNIPA